MLLFISIITGAVFLLIGVPIAFALLAIPSIYLSFDAIAPFLIVPQRMLGSINSFPLMAVPFFVLMGQAMNSGGITDRIFKFADSLVGHLRGGLGHVNVMASLLMSGMSGSAVADASGLGQVEIDAMVKRGYGRPFSAAITAASATIGPIIPPSIPLVIYGTITSTSISQLLLAGIIPGVLMGLGLMAVTTVTAIKHGFPIEPKANLKQIADSFIKAFPALMTPVILIGGILSGVFTPTEASAVAAIYAIIIALFVYKTLNLKGLYKVLLDSAHVIGTIFFIIGAAAVFSWLFTRLNVPQKMALMLQNTFSAKWVMLLLVNGFILIVGCFLEANAGLIFTAPLLFPVMTQIGVDPVHFGVILVMNLMIGLITPPVGINMYVVTKIAKINVVQFCKAILPFAVILITVLLMITFIPNFSLLLPKLMFR